MFQLYNSMVGRLARGRRPAADALVGWAPASSDPGDHPVSAAPNGEEERPRWAGAFAGPPGHQPIAWVGTLAGVGLLAATLVIAVIGAATPLLLLALLGIGVAEGGWAVELLPRRWVVVAR